jgi:hypothetical protein
VALTRFLLFLYVQNILQLQLFVKALLPILRSRFGPNPFTRTVNAGHSLSPWTEGLAAAASLWRFSKTIERFVKSPSFTWLPSAGLFETSRHSLEAMGGLFGQTLHHASHA